MGYPNDFVILRRTHEASQKARDEDMEDVYWQNLFANYSNGKSKSDNMGKIILTTYLARSWLICK